MLYSTIATTNPLFSGNSALPCHQIQGAIRVLHWSGNEALKSNEHNKETSELIAKPQKTTRALTKGWSLRQAFLSSAKRALAIPDII